MDRQIPKDQLRRESIRRYAIGAGAALVITIAVWMVLGLTHASVKKDQLKYAEVKIATIESTLSSSGTVNPAFEQIITSPISSRIVEVYCKAGDKLEPGMPILRLDLATTQSEYNRLTDSRDMKRLSIEQQRLANATRANDLDMRIRVKEMDLDRMKATLLNERYLDSLGSGTGEQVRQAEIEYEKCRLELEQLRIQARNDEATSLMQQKSQKLELDIAERDLSLQSQKLEDALLRAPRSATLTSVIDQIGHTVGMGEQVATLADLSHFAARGEISDQHASKVVPGAGVIVKSGKNTVRGTISTVTPQSSNGMVAYTVSLADDDAPFLRSGLKVDIYILTEVIEDAITIPNIPAYAGPGIYQLFVVADDGKRIEQRSVTLGAANYDLVEVVGGLSQGETIVTTDMSKYKNNKYMNLK